MANTKFKQFHERLGKPLYAPDFLDSLAAVMADPNSVLEERVLAWAKYFAWGNHNEFAVRSESGGKQPLKQRDCAEDLAWLQAGRRVEWLDAPRHIRSLELKRLEIKPLDKSSISKAFRLNTIRGTLEPTTSQDIRPAVSPKVGHSREIRRGKVESPAHKEFMDFARIEYSKEFQEREVARSTVARLDNFFLSAFKSWKRTRTSETNPALFYKPTETKTSSSEEQKTSESAAPRPTTGNKWSADDPLAEPPAGYEPPPAPHNITATEFNEAICGKFEAINANTPTKHQTDVEFHRLADAATPFLEWLSPSEMHRRRVRHGGILPLLVEEFVRLRKKLQKHVGQCQPGLTRAASLARMPKCELCCDRGIVWDVNGRAGWCPTHCEAVTDKLNEDPNYVDEWNAEYDRNRPGETHDLDRTRGVDSSPGTEPP